MRGMSCDFVYRHGLFSLILFISFIVSSRSFSLSVLLDLAMDHEKLKGTSAGDTGNSRHVVTFYYFSIFSLCSLLQLPSSSRTPPDAPAFHTLTRPPVY
jgi:hypothetical protein